MATTAIVAEILIVGLQAFGWVALLVIAIFGADWIHLNFLKGWETLATILVLAVAYVLGIIVDRISDTANAFIKRLWPLRPIDRPAAISVMRLSVMREGGLLATFLDYQRSRTRIARSTTFNLLAFSGTLTLFLFARTSSGWRIVVIIGLLVAVVMIAQITSRRIEVAYVERLSEAYRMVRQLPDIQIAAAVVHRQAGGQPEFLLVRTRDGQQWTFPKGHRQVGETLARAAAREAREEAGITGQVSPLPLTQFRYPATRTWEDESDVAAFLLRVKQPGVSTSTAAQRERRWMSFDEACASLADGGREQQYVSEMRRVLGIALSKLGERPRAPAVWQEREP